MKPDAFDLVMHLVRQSAFSLATFGPGDAAERAAGLSDHIRKELAEIARDPMDLEEWIDIVILGFEGAWRTGASPVQICEALLAKQRKNETRIWPDWKTATPGKAIEHVRHIDLSTLGPASPAELVHDSECKAIDPDATPPCNTGPRS